MMLYPLLPFFLAAKIPGNDVWTHGPEYNFTGHLNMIRLDDGGNNNGGTILELKLYCRPRVPDVLRCHMKDANIKLLKPHREGDNNDPRKFGIYEKPFEIKFNEHGIDSYVVDRTDQLISSWQLNMIPLIGNQLSIGIDLSNETNGVYKSLENFTVGECEVHSKVTQMSTDGINETDSPDLHEGLVPLESLGKLSDGTIEIKKRRNITDCLRCAQPFFGSRYSLGVILRDVNTRLKKSESKIYLSKQKFRSDTVNESELYSSDLKNLGTVEDTIELTLDSFYPAKHPLEKFENPMSVGMSTDCA